MTISKENSSLKDQIQAMLVTARIMCNHSNTNIADSLMMVTPSAISQLQPQQSHTETPLRDTAQIQAVTFPLCTAPSFSVATACAVNEAHCEIHNQDRQLLAKMRTCTPQLLYYCHMPQAPMRIMRLLPKPSNQSMQSTDRAIAHDCVLDQPAVCGAKPNTPTK